jgi:hypothetical protein
VIAISPLSARKLIRKKLLRNRLLRFCARVELITEGKDGLSLWVSELNQPLSLPCRSRGGGMATEDGGSQSENTMLFPVLVME